MAGQKFARQFAHSTGKQPGEFTTRWRPPARRDGGSQTPRRRSPALINPGHGRHNHNTVISNAAGMGQRAVPIAAAKIRAGE